jgi:chromate transporter
MAWRAHRSAEEGSDELDRCSRGGEPVSTQAPSPAPGAAVPFVSPIPFGDAVRVWVKVAANSFGGPAGQIAVMHRVLVEEKRWISESRFLHALNYCMLLPGPEAQQLAIYIGWLLHRTLGGIVAGTLFVLPGFFSILALSVLYASYQDTHLVQALFYGLKPAVMAVVVEAVVRIGRRSLKNGVMVGLAAAAFVAIFFFAVPIPLCVLTAGVVALSGARASVPAFLVVRLKAETIATLAACAGAGVVLSDARCHRSAVQASAPTSIV